MYKYDVNELLALNLKMLGIELQHFIFGEHPFMSRCHTPSHSFTVSE